MRARDWMLEILWKAVLLVIIFVRLAGSQVYLVMGQAFLDPVFC